ncbi:hybrid sensor histidine kinase/response regulator [Cohnella sp. 56]|uniref:hybrid sensor histidine kinase/response regulator n=1 Tax=Cohnella sp. 56 TaxID=3113722 RepID=UPI0030EA1E70
MSAVTDLAERDDSENKRRGIDRFLVGLIISVLLLGTVMISVNHSGRGGPQATAGVMDLSAWNLATDGMLRLDGEWEFYPNQLLSPADFAGGRQPDGKRYIQVPSIWNGKGMKGHGYATYRLLIKLRPTDQTLAIHKQVIRFSDRMFVNGREAASAGTPAKERSGYKPGNFPYTVSFLANGDRVELVVQVANYEYPNGGIALPLRFGLSDDIQLSRSAQTMFEWSGAIILLLFGIFSLALYFFFQRNPAFLSFGLFFLCFAVLIVLNGQRMLFQILSDMPFELMWKIKDLSILLSIPFLFVYTAFAYASGLSRRMLLYPAGAIGLFCLVIVWVPYRMYAPVLDALMLVYMLLLASLVLFIVSKYCSGRAGNNSSSEIRMYILALVSLLLVLISSAFLNQGDGTFLPSIMSDIFGLSFVAFVVMMLAQNYFATYRSMVKLTEELQAANQLKDEFLLRTSYELNTPLQGIMNLSQSLLDSSAQLPKDRRVGSRDKLQIIRNTAYRMSNLVHDIIDLTRIKDGRLEVALKPVDLVACVAIAFEVNGFLAREKSVRLEHRLAAESRYATADENRIMQVLSNLLDYCMKFDDLTAIIVTGHSAGERSVLEIEAIVWGAGIMADSKSREPGFYGANLAAAVELTRLMGGEMRVVPGELERGSVIFELSLPMAERPSAGGLGVHLRESGGDAQAGPSVLSPAGGVYTVLVVEEEPLHLELMVNLLVSEGYRVLTARSGEEAMERIEASRPDIVLLDVLLHGGGSYEISRAIRRTYTPIELPLLFVTARTTPADVEAGLAAGGNDFISKPLDASEVRVRIRTQLAMKRLAKEATESEMAFLQSQIKPHFLYNALGTIMSLCYTDGPRAGELLAVLSKYLRIIFHEDHKEESVLLRREIELVRAYVDIEKERFGSRLAVDIDIDEGLMSTKVMPLTIQPLIENAIRHGVAKKLNGGRVLLSVRRRGGEVEIVVEDNGVGMAERQVRELMKTGGGTSEGVGFANIAKRLSHLNGSRPLIESEPGVGTRITIRLPGEEDTKGGDRS